LPPRDIRSHYETGAFCVQDNHLTRTQPAVSPGGIIEALGVRKRVILPGSENQAIPDGLN